MATEPRRRIPVCNRLGSMAGVHYVRRGMFTWKHWNTTGSAITEVSARYPAWCVQPGSWRDPENLASSPPSALYVTAAIEYGGKTYPFSRNGNPRLEIAALETGQFDPIPNLIIPAGADFKEHVYVEAQDQTSGFIFHGERNALYRLGDRVTITDAKDLTLKGGSTDAPRAFNCGYSALAILGVPLSTARSRAILILGDSNGVGYSETRPSGFSEFTSDPYGNVGAFERIAGAEVPYVNLSRGSLSTMHARSASQFLRRFGALSDLDFTDVIWALGRNDIDISPDITLGNIEKGLTVLRSVWPGLEQCVIATLPPTTQGDWAGSRPAETQHQDAQSLAMQANRIVVNRAIRSHSIPGQNALLDLAAALEVNGEGISEVDGRYWKAGQTLDGVHLNALAHQRVASENPWPALISADRPPTKRDPSAIRYWPAFWSFVRKRGYPGSA